MSELTLDDVKSFHSELIRIAAAGIPIQLRIGETRENLAATLDHLLANFDAKLQKQESLESAIESETSLSDTYRSALQRWLFDDHSPAAFDSLTISAIEHKQKSRLVQLALIQPIILIAIAYVALIYICAVTIPKFESMYEQLYLSPRIALSIMSWIRKGMWIWIPLVPLALVISYAAWLKRTNSPLASSTQVNGQSIERVLNPIQRWLADVRACRAQKWVPPIVLVIIGGFLVLGIGLSVFLPLVELFSDVTVER